MNTRVLIKKLYLDRLVKIKKAPIWYQTAVYLLIFLIGLSFLSLLTKPIRHAWAANYISAGDKYLLEAKYNWAELSYAKASLLEPSNKVAKSQKKLAVEGSGDISKLLDFFKREKATASLQLYSESTVTDKKYYDLTILSQSLIGRGQYQYAIIPAERSVALNDTYRDGWLYLGIANLRAATNLKTDKNVLKNYLAEAKKAFDRAALLDPVYQPIKDYQGEAEKVKI
ncbi:MAG: hypothetical protein WCG48_01730 [Candidatus Berkelbacteria bacterium]